MLIDCEIGIDYADCGPWRSYHVYAEGETVEQLMNDATISEVGQDGGDLDSYSFAGASETIQDKLISIFEASLKKWNDPQWEHARHLMEELTKCWNEVVKERACECRLVHKESCDAYPFVRDFNRLRTLINE
jgi:Fe-S-cluster containining protein